LNHRDAAACFALSLQHRCIHHTHTHTHTHTRLTALSGTTQVSRYQKGKTNLDFTKARDSEWQWHQVGHMPVCTSLQTDNHASTLTLSFYRPDALPAAQPTASKHCIHHYRNKSISAVLAIAPRLRQSVTCRRSIETNGRIKLVYGTTLPSNYPTLCYKKIRDFGCLQNDRLTVLSFGTFSETLDLKILLWQVDRVVNKTHRQSS